MPTPPPTIPHPTKLPPVLLARAPDIAQKVTPVALREKILVPLPFPSPLRPLLPPARLLLLLRLPTTAPAAPTEPATPAADMPGAAAPLLVVLREHVLPQRRPRARRGLVRLPPLSLPLLAVLLPPMLTPPPRATGPPLPLPLRLPPMLPPTPGGRRLLALLRLAIALRLQLLLPADARHLRQPEVPVLLQSVPAHPHQRGLILLHLPLRVVLWVFFFGGGVVCV